MAVGGSLEHARDGLEICGVRCQRDRSGSGRGDLGGSRTQAGFVAASDHHPGAGGGHLTGSREADSAGPAGEQNPLTGQVEVVVPIVQPRSNGVADAAEPADDGRPRAASITRSGLMSPFATAPRTAARSSPCPR